MGQADHFILILGGLVLLGILAGVLSSRIGAPLLLVFLGVGMLLGEDGPGGLQFGNFRTTYVVGSVALAIILFDGGFRTPMSAVRMAWAPATMLATVGVVVTAVVTAGFAMLAFDIDMSQALLIGTIVASTDAAAVFLLLHQHGMELRKRLSATLEIESGANDPMAIFLTITLVTIIAAGGTASPFEIFQGFARQFLTGAVAGVAGGYLISRSINKLELAAGLYPVFTVAAALALFGLTQLIGGSGFLAVYLAGIVAGNRRLRARKLIGRFHDGMAWISQILMFVMLGLLVTPTNLLKDIVPSTLVALALVFIVRPLAVFLSLIPFRFRLRERIFIAWVGLRGAVPIFLAMIPVLGGLPHSLQYFNVAFLVVIVSLVLQGWTVPWLARRLRLQVPPRPEPSSRLDLDLLASGDSDIIAYRVTDKSPIAHKKPGTLTLPTGAHVLAVLRDEQVVAADKADHFMPGDLALMISPPEQAFKLDRQFVPPTAERYLLGINVGDFAFAGTTPMKLLADAYGLPVIEADREKKLSRFLRERLGSKIGEGDVLAFGGTELVVRELIDGEVSQVGLVLEPEPPLPILSRLRGMFR
ncbi:potassium/proton antiporter [Govanella unica]|uniref:Potassium/proton antiporter n=1 Tax=Govanella unica TaxID=2975056 RepID=A0A9X3U009_9PROT|nr:potassium/proton antiporter [Govania unica]MDA5195125.1 potassium/proton antiporter [Govania unica]